MTGICYRPPRQCDFYELLELSFNEANDFSECIRLGDFNTNVLVPSSNNILVNTLRNFERVFGYKQLITEPTRMCDNSESAIDLILVTDHEKVCQSGVLNVGINDHLITYCTRKVITAPVNKHNTVRMRCTKHYSKDLFIQNLDDIDWSDIFNCHNVDIAWGKFKSILLSIIDKVAPYKEVRVKQRTKPWMSSEILNLIRQRDKYLRKFRRSKDQSDYKLFVYHRNQVKYKKEKAKSQYCVHAVNENQNRPKNDGKF